jgi:Flp pilus assembly protein TadD
MSRVNIRIIIVVATLLMIFSFEISDAATTPNEGVCDVAADVALAHGDYPTAIALHRRVLQSERNNASAHYHLGFAYGMVGRTTEEIDEYRTAIALGLKSWDLFLNLGLAYVDRHEFERATAALETAAALGPEHAETHFNLALAYERENRLGDALAEIIVSLVLAPQDLDAANTDAIICAKMGNVAAARNIWTQLVQTAPDYAAARANLAIPNQSCGEACGRYPHSHKTGVLSQFAGVE